jgi:hypothetical protein
LNGRARYRCRVDWRRRNWWWVLLAALAIACFAPSSGGAVASTRHLGGPAVSNLDLRFAEPAVLAGADGASAVLDSNRSAPDPFLRIVGIIAAIGIAAAAMRGRARIRVPIGERPRIVRRGDVLLRGPPRFVC